MTKLEMLLLKVGQEIKKLETKANLVDQLKFLIDRKKSGEGNSMVAKGIRKKRKMGRRKKYASATPEGNPVDLEEKRAIGKERYGNKVTLSKLILDLCSMPMATHAIIDAMRASNHEVKLNSVNATISTLYAKGKLVRVGKAVYQTASGPVTA